MRVWDRRPGGLAAALGAPDALTTHQALDLAARDLLAFAQQRQPGPPIPVGLVVRLVDRPDDWHEPLILDRPC